MLLLCPTEPCRSQMARAHESSWAETTSPQPRGLRSLRLSDEFLREGGSEMALMSTTRELEVAVKYSTSACSVLLKLETRNFRERGADLTFLSAFPAECEVLYPPLTHCEPVRSQEVRTEGGVTFTVIEVRPSYG